MNDEATHHLLAEIGASELDLRQGVSMHDREDVHDCCGRYQKSTLTCKEAQTQQIVLRAGRKR